MAELHLSAVRPPFLPEDEACIAIYAFLLNVESFYRIHSCGIRIPWLFKGEPVYVNQ